LNSRRLVLNIGNTRIAAAVCADAQIGQSKHFLLEEYSSVANYVKEQVNNGIVQVALCSVVPPVTKQLLAALGEAAENLFEIEGTTQTVLTGLYPGIGADRVANAAAAYKMYSQNTPVIVLDFGTASTMTVVSAKGEFIGGLITLGLGKTFSSLHQSTAQLPNMHFEFREREITPLARDTETSIASGAVLAHVGMIKQWTESAKAQLGQDVTVVATGGYSENLRPFIANSVNVFDYLLTLKGINLIAAAAIVSTGPG